MTALLFGQMRVDRKAYAVTGFALMATKYAVEAVLVRLTAGRWWTPLEYFDPWFRSRFAVAGPRVLPANVWVSQVPEWLPWFLVLWTIPFIWVGVSMSVRRAADAGVSPWIGLLFLVPWVNYGAMLLLAVLPSSARADWSRRPESARAVRFGSVMTSATAGVVLSLLLILFATSVVQTYGTLLFVGVPVVFGAFTAYLLNRGAPRPLRSTMGAIALAFAALMMLTLVMGIEGLGCWLMMLPLAIPLALLGAYVGWSIAVCTRMRRENAALPLLLLPLLILVEERGELAVHEVRSSIEIAAPPEVVWERLVSFGQIPDPPEWMFRLGVACPTGARIEGSGKGAVRHCEFTTGTFVEPVTDWDPPRRLAFDVASQPPPMIEWSPWDIHPPHLDGFLATKRGEFRLVALPGGRTRLEGSTWYSLDIHPEPYWRLYSDFLIGVIHERVLRHVRRLSEGG